MAIERLTLPAQHYIYVDRDAPFDGAAISEAMASGFASVFGFAAEKDVEPLTMPMAVYVEMPSADRMAFRAGVFVSAEDAARADGEVKAGVIPAGEVVKRTHVGPYASLSQSHEALSAEAEAQGLPHAMPAWEIYVDDPGQTPEPDLRTEIYRVLNAG